jgi:hypothetical protein
VLAGFAGVIVFFKVYAWLGVSNWSLGNVAATLSNGDSSHRWELYGMAWPLLQQHFLDGIGYFNFGYYWQMHKVPPFLEGDTFFVHNDYLQLALETGVLGIGILGGTIWLTLRQLLVFRGPVLARQRLEVILPAVAIVSMLSHALVDFPFYIPALIAIFAVYVGFLDQQFLHLGSRSIAFPHMPPMRGLRAGFLKELALVMTVIWLGLPAFAETAAHVGLWQLRHGDARLGLWWNQLASNLQPREADYYWRSGIVLRNLCTALHSRDQCTQADAQFAKGVQANPFEVNNLVERVKLHREYQALLENPATPQQQLAWMMQARQLQPYSDTVQAELVRTLASAGKRDAAIVEAEALVRKRPKSRTARMLLEELRSGRA